MKPSSFSVGLSLVLCGAGLIAWGLFGIPSPTYLGLGGTVGILGLLVILHVRIAYTLGLLLGLGTSTWGGYSLWRALETAGHPGIIKAGVFLAAGLYLLVSLFAVRANFKK
jgi:hypothetical protein